jgi:hypothetical protein
MIRTPFPDRVHNQAHLDVRPIEIFDLSSDRKEKRDLSSSMGGPDDRHSVMDGSAAVTKMDARMAQELGRRAEKALHTPASALTGPTRLPEPLLEQLRSLGYAQ